MCNTKIVRNNYWKKRTVCKNCYRKNRRENSFNSIIQNESKTCHQKPKIKNVNKNKNIRSLIIGFPTCGKTYLMTYILFWKQEPIFIITESSNQYTSIKAQTSDEIQPLNECENSTVVFDDILLTKQDNNIDLFFARGRHKNIDIYYISQSYFHLPKNTVRKNSNIFIYFQQTLRDTILHFHDIAGLDMKLEEWEQLCREDWVNEYDYLQIDRFAKLRKGRYTIRNCNKTMYTECTPETKPFGVS